ncbi:MAG TPA: hypothetical protein VGA52_04390 [Anaerolineales bacterium]|jgi:hypothetical protein
MASPLDETSQLMDQPIAELVDRWPCTGQVFIDHRMACVGCLFARFHNARQALDIYQRQLQPFRDDLTSAVSAALSHNHPAE